MSRITKLSRRAKIIYGVILIAVLVGGYFLFFRPSPAPEVVKVERRNLTQVVAVTGTVKPVSIIDLEFLSSNRVVWRPVAVGDKVRRGQVLMALDARDADIQIAKAEAALAGNRAKLEQLKMGSTPESIRQAENAVDASYRSALSSLDTALTKADKALTVLRTEIFTSANTVRTDFLLPHDSYLSRAEQEKSAADADLAKARAAREEAARNFSQVPVPAEVDTLFNQAPELLNSTRAVMVTTIELLRRVVSSAISQSTVNGYITDVATAQGEFESAMTSLTTSIASIQAAKDTLRVKREPPRSVDIEVLEANVKSTEADLALLKKQKSDLALTAPADGVITDLKYEVGEVARTGATAVSMISGANAEIEANVPEVDIAKLAIAENVSITLDSLPGEKFSGKVVHIDPAETLVDGVTNYKVKISFDANDPRVKPGSTANLDIETLKKENVLSLPQFGIVEKDEGTFVRKLVSGNSQELPVKIGIRSSDGYIEILDGLSEGEEVLNAGLKIVE
ncbi:MAG: efflux RND transporter periplasmic adaptor subunit [Candidatus Sungbacteria bacterium]|nr:efflux RND transporter periplasmic adaptor subunit [Candidatus Sungbacteria bacterium]